MATYLLVVRVSHLYMLFGMIYESIERMGIRTRSGT